MTHSVLPIQSKTYPQIGPQGIPKYAAGGRFQFLASGSAKYCGELSIKALELETALVGGAPFALRRDRYPRNTLCLADPGTAEEAWERCRQYLTVGISTGTVGLILGRTNR